MDNKILISYLESGKYTISDKKVIFIGIVTKTIYDKTIFKHNPDLHNYISIFETNLLSDDKEPFKDYLFDSRTLLASRVCRLINSEDDSIKIKKLISEHLDFINSKKDTSSKEDHKKNANKDSSLLNDFINLGKENK